MKLLFPQDSDDWSAAYNNALACGEFSNDPRQRDFWAKFDLIASDVEGDEIVADWFFNTIADRYTRVSRKESSG